MKTSGTRRSLKKGYKLNRLFTILLVFLGIIVGFLIFACLFTGQRKSALIIEIVAAIFGFLASLWLSVSCARSWYHWPLLFGIPILLQGLFWGLLLTGGKDVKQDVAILVSSGFLAMTSSLIGGYLGRLIGRLRSGKQSLN